MRSKLIILSLAVLIAVGAAGFYLLKSEREGDRLARMVHDGNPRQGREAIIRHGCFACHVIAGIGKANGRVGPKLLELGQQIYLGGVVANTPEGMIRWLRAPRSFSPETAMPDLDITEQEARDIAAYLYENE